MNSAVLNGKDKELVEEKNGKELGRSKKEPRKELGKIFWKKQRKKLGWNFQVNGMECMEETWNELGRRCEKRLRETGSSNPSFFPVTSYFTPNFVHKYISLHIDIFPVCSSLSWHIVGKCSTSSIWDGMIFKIELIRHYKNWGSEIELR